jgi:hypothetical protein
MASKPERERPWPPSPPNSLRIAPRSTSPRCRRPCRSAPASSCSTSRATSCAAGTTPKAPPPCWPPPAPSAWPPATPPCSATAPATPRPAPALLNGALAHSLDFDDTHAAGTLHPGAPVIPAALAAAEMAGADGRTGAVRHRRGLRGDVPLGPRPARRRPLRPRLPPHRPPAAPSGPPPPPRASSASRRGVEDAFGIALSQAPAACNSSPTAPGPSASRWAGAPWPACPPPCSRARASAARPRPSRARPASSAPTRRTRCRSARSRTSAPPGS